MSATPNAPLTLSIANISVNANNVSASETLPAATGGDGNYTYSIRTPSNLPTGVTAASNFSTSRTINVSANRNGSFSMTVRVTDGTGAVDDETFTFGYDTRAQQLDYVDVGTWSGAFSVTVTWDSGEVGDVVRAFPSNAPSDSDGQGFIWFLSGSGSDPARVTDASSPVSLSGTAVWTGYVREDYYITGQHSPIPTSISALVGVQVFSEPSAGGDVTITATKD